MVSQCQKSLGTETKFHSKLIGMVSRINIDTTNAHLHGSSSCLMWLNVFCSPPFPFLALCRPGVIIEPRVTTESSGLLSVSSELRMKVTKANKDDKFYCEVTYLVPGETRMTESNYIDIKVLCEFHKYSNHHDIHISHQILNSVPVCDCSIVVIVNHTD